MALEEALVEVTKAVTALNANLASILGGKAPAADGVKRPPGRPKAITMDEVKAIAEKLRDAKGREAAVAMIVKHGARSLAELDKQKYSEFIAAAEVAINAEPEPEPEPEPDAEL